MDLVADRKNIGKILYGTGFFGGCSAQCPAVVLSQKNARACLGRDKRNVE